MVRSEWQQYLVHQHDMLEVVDNALSIQKVHGRCQPIPVERFRKSQPSGSTRDVCDSYNFLERDDLNSCDNGNDVDVTHEHGGEEDTDHHHGPECSGHEGLLLLLIFGWAGILRRLFKICQCCAQELCMCTLTSIFTSPFLPSVAASDPPSLMSEKLLLLPSWCPLDLWVNLTLRRGMAMRICACALRSRESQALLIVYAT